MKKVTVEKQIEKLEIELENAQEPRASQIQEQIRQLKKKPKKSRRKRAFLLPILFLVLAACGKGEGGAAAGESGPGHVADSTPHEYTVLFAALTNSDQIHTGTIHQICAVGFLGFRDLTANFNLMSPNITGGVGCTAAENISTSATNTGTLELYLAISVDGVWLPDVIIQPGETYLFERGY